MAQLGVQGTRKEASAGSDNTQNLNELKGAEDALRKQLAEESKRIDKSRKTAASMVEMTKNEYYNLKDEHSAGWTEQIKRRGFGDWLVGKTVGEGTYNEAVEKQAKLAYDQRLEHEDHVRKTGLELDDKLRRAGTALATKDYAKAQQLLSEVKATNLSFDNSKGKEQREQAMAEVREANEGRISTAQNWETGLRVTDTVATVATIATGVGAVRAGAGLVVRGAVAAGNTFAIQTAHDVSAEATSTVVDLASGATASQRLEQAAQNLTEKTKSNLTTAALTGTGVGVATKLSAAFGEGQALLAGVVSRGSAGSIQSTGQEIKRQIDSGQGLDATKVGAQAALGFTAGAVGGTSTKMGATVDEIKNLAVAGGTAVVGTALTTGLDNPNARSQIVQQTATMYLGAKVGQALQKSSPTIPSPSATSKPESSTPSQATPPPAKAPDSTRTTLQPKPELAPQRAATDPAQKPPTDTSPRGNNQSIEQIASSRADKAAQTYEQLQMRQLRESGKELTPERQQEIATKSAEVRRLVQERVLSESSKPKDSDPSSSPGSRTTDATKTSAETKVQANDELARAEAAREAALLAKAEYQRAHPTVSEQKLREVSSRVFADKFRELTAQSQSTSTASGPAVASKAGDTAGRTSPTNAEATRQTGQEKTAVQSRKEDHSPESLERHYHRLVEETGADYANAQAALARQHLQGLQKVANPTAQVYRSPQQIEAESKRAYQKYYDAEMRKAGLPPKFNVTPIEREARTRAEDAGFKVFMGKMNEGDRSLGEARRLAQDAYQDTYRSSRQALVQQRAAELSKTWLNGKLEETARSGAEVTPSVRTQLEAQSQRIERLAYERINRGLDANSPAPSGSTLPPLTRQAMERIEDRVNRDAYLDYLRKQLVEPRPERDVSQQKIVASNIHPGKHADPATLAEYKGRLGSAATTEHLETRNKTPQAMAEKLAIEGTTKRS